MVRRLAGSTLVLLGLLGPLPALAEPAAAPLGVTIRVYDSAGVRAGDLRNALETAAAIVSGAAIALDWRLCGRHGADGIEACGSVPTSGELLVRIVRARLAPTGGQLPLGDALVDPKAGTGTLATVYANRVRWTAQEAGIDEATLLGRAIAHELGHLLLASNRHGTRGLMRGTWRADELGANHDHDWGLAPEDAAAIRDRVWRRLRSFPAAAPRPG